MQIKFPEEAKPRVSWVQLVWQERMKVLSGTLLLFFCIFAITWGVLKRGNTAQDYFEASMYRAALESQNKVETVDILKMVKKHPELSPLFTPYLEEVFALAGDVAEVKQFSEEALKRLSFVNPLYIEFARGSILMEEGRYEEALQNSLKVKSEIRSEEHPDLFGLNEVRICFLETLLERTPSTESLSSLSDRVASHLKDEKLSFVDAISSWKNH